MRHPVECLAEIDHPTNDHDGRRRDAWIVQIAEIAEGRLIHELLSARRAAHEGDGLVRLSARCNQAGGDGVNMFHRHIHDDHRRTVGHAFPIDSIRHKTAGVVTGQKCDAVISIPVGYRNTGIGQSTNACGYARHDTKRDVVIDQSQGFFAAPPEHEGITALQTKDALPVLRQRNKAQGNISLFRRRLSTSFARIFQNGITARHVENAVTNKRVVDDSIGLLQGIDTVQGQKTRVAGARTNKPDPTGLECRQMIEREFHDPDYAWTRSRKPALLRRQRVAYKAVMSEPPTSSDESSRKPAGPLRRGWTTGACATAATKAALTALITGEFPDPVAILLPKGDAPHFALCYEGMNEAGAFAGIVKDAGDDPDVTHGATIIAQVIPLPPGSGIQFRAGDGVGTVTMPGLPIEPGEAAINPVPRQMMREVVMDLCYEHGLPADLGITISIPGGEEIAQKTWNPRLGIEGGLSILGTTGVVHPYSCSSWIHSIHRGIDVARAAGHNHVLAATGSTSESAALALYDLPETALLDMGDFAGGVLKYLREHPVPRITIAGGFAKLTKLAQGALDLHSARSQVDFTYLVNALRDLGADDDLVRNALDANTAAHVLSLAQKAGLDLAHRIAKDALATAQKTLRDAPVAVDIIVVDRAGTVIAQAQ